VPLLSSLLPPCPFFKSGVLTHPTVRGQTGFSRDLLSELSAFVAAHNIKPVIAQEFAFADMISAFEALQKQNAVGKIVVRIGGADA
jgi:NADPH:quinone reductase-like Zn-dependent oxidoreductase